MRGVDCFFAALIAMTLPACNIFKKVTTKATSDQHKTLVVDQGKLGLNREVQTDQHFLEWRLDSAKSNDVVMIWPKGRFTFSALHGFEGEANYMWIQSNTFKSSKQLTAKDSLSRTKEELNVQQKHKIADQTKTKTTAKTKAPEFWPIVAIAFIAITGGIIIRFFKGYLDG